MNQTRLIRVNPCPSVVQPGGSSPANSQASTRFTCAREYYFADATSRVEGSICQVRRRKAIFFFGFFIGPRPTRMPRMGHRRPISHQRIPSVARARISLDSAVELAAKGRREHKERWGTRVGLHLLGKVFGKEIPWPKPIAVRPSCPFAAIQLCFRAIYIVPPPTTGRLSRNGARISGLVC